MATSHNPLFTSIPVRTSHFIPHTGKANVLFYPPPSNTFHFFKCMPNYFKGSEWLKVCLPGYERHGRVWIEPKVSKAELTKFFKDKGFELNLLPKEALSPE